MVTIGNYKNKNRLFRAFSGNLPETKAKKNLSPENENTHAPPHYCIRGKKWKFVYILWYWARESRSKSRPSQIGLEAILKSHMYTDIILNNVGMVVHLPHCDARYTATDWLDCVNSRVVLAAPRLANVPRTLGVQLAQGPVVVGLGQLRTSGARNWEKGVILSVYNFSFLSLSLLKHIPTCPPYFVIKYAINIP